MLEKLFRDSLNQFNSFVPFEKNKIIEKVVTFSSNFPSSDDEILGAIDRLFLIQDSYNLNITQFAQGNIR